MRARTTALHLLAAFGFAAPLFAAGMLVPRNGMPPIGVKSHRVTAVVEDGLARTTLRQTFVNPHSAPLQAVYQFPLPEGAALVEVAMEVGGQRLEGLLAERQKARQVYNRIVSRRKDPALVEQIGRNTFRLSVFPVVPQEDTVVELTWIQRVPLVGGEYHYVYPLGTGGEAAVTEDDLTVMVTMKSSLPLVRPHSPTSGMEVVQRSEHEVVASMEHMRGILDTDVVLVAGVNVDEPTLTIATFKGEGDEDGYFMATITPPPADEEELLPRDVILVIDSSGSMEGEKMQQALSSARYLLTQLRPHDRVNVLRFSSGVFPFADEPVPATPDNLAAISAFIDRIQASGGTAFGDALRQALAVAPAAGRVRSVVLLTDGLPTIGDRDPLRLVGLAHDGAARGLRVYPFGVGQDVDAGLLRGVASAGRGSAEIFRIGGEIESRLRSFLDRIASPAVADIQLAVEGAGLYDVFPRPVPDAYLGEQVTIVGRYREGGLRRATVSATVAAPGGADGALVTRKTEIACDGRFEELPGGSLVVRDLFARHKLDFLEEHLRLRQGLADDAYYAALDRGGYSTADEVVAEIIDVSLDCGVQCAYTSFLVLLPEDRRRLDPRSSAELQDALERTRAARRRTWVAAAGEPAREGVKQDEEPVILDAEEADPNETADAEDFTQAKGQADQLSDKPYEGRGFLSNLGMGGGGGGTFGGRSGGRRDLLIRGGGGEATQNAVDDAQRWLATQQAPDGSWSGSTRDTGLSLLAFLGAGSTHRSGPHRASIRSGLRYLQSIQTSDGCFGAKSEGYLLDNAIAAAAFSEAYALSGRSPLLRGFAQKGIDFLVSMQTPGSGWLTGTGSVVEDAVLTGWAVMALKSAKVSQLDVPRAAFTGALTWIDAAVLPGDASAGPALGMLGIARVFLGCKRDDPSLLAIGERLAGLLPTTGSPGGDLGLHHIHAGTLAMFQLGGEPWKQWNAALKSSLAPGATGNDGWWAADSSCNTTVEATALATLSLETYYRYGKVFK